MKGIVFDMDGIILASETFSDRTWMAAAKERNLDINIDLINKCRGTNKNDTIEIFKKHDGESFDGEGFLSRTSELFHQIEEAEGIPLMHYSKEILEYLKPRYTLALASSTRGPTVERQLRTAGVIDFFETRTTGDMVVHSKPDSEIYLMACKSVGLEPSECYAIEDSLNGIKSAYATGLKPIMVVDKIQPTDEIRKMCVAVFDSLEGLKELF